MRRSVVTCALFLFVSAVLHADLTLTQSISIEGAAAAMMGGAAAPVITTRIKGTKARVESSVMGNTSVVLLDLVTKQVITLSAADKTARVADSQAPGATAGAPVSSMDFSFKTTGQKRTIDNFACDEYAIAMSMNMGEMMKSNAQVPPEAQAMLQGVTMIIAGSSWIAKDGPAVAEFTAFQKAALAAGMGGTLSGAMGGSGNGLDKVIAASAGQGLPYLTEMTMNLEGTGQIVEMMKQMGALKMGTKVTAVSTDVLSDDLFKVPAGYTMVK
jgi:hypothetical protein